MQICCVKPKVNNTGGYGAKLGALHCNRNVTNAGHGRRCTGIFPVSVPLAPLLQSCVSQRAFEPLPSPASIDVSLNICLMLN